jgi:hypothetical protein
LFSASFLFSVPPTRAPHAQRRKDIAQFTNQCIQNLEIQLCMHALRKLKGVSIHVISQYDDT